MIIRSEVTEFSKKMELRLRELDKHRGHRGWKHLDVEPMIARLHSNMRDLVDAQQRGDKPRMMAETIDIGNMAMIIADLIGMDVEPTPHG